MMNDRQTKKLTTELQTKTELQPEALEKVPEALNTAFNCLVDLKEPIYSELPSELGPGEKKLVLAFSAGQFAHNEGARTKKQYIADKSGVPSKPLRRRWIPNINSLTTGILVAFVTNSPLWGLVTGTTSIAIDYLWIKYGHRLNQ